MDRTYWFKGRGQFECLEQRTLLATLTNDATRYDTDTDRVETDVLVLDTASELRLDFQHNTVTLRNLDAVGLVGNHPLRSDYPVAHSEVLATRDVPSSHLNTTASKEQLVYLDLDGAVDVTYDGPTSISGIDIPMFAATSHLKGQENAVIESLVRILQQNFEGSQVILTTDLPEGTIEYSTIFVGGSDLAFSDYGSFLGIAEQVDIGNTNQRDNAFVFPENIPNSGTTTHEFAQRLASVITHEMGHLLGVSHSIDKHHIQGPLDAVAWNVFTHLETAKDVRADVLDGKVTLNNDEYDVHPRIVESLQKYPAFFYAGTTGPDAFPDTVYGQQVMHAIDSGVWMQRALDMAWAAQSDTAPFSDDEKLQALAFAYGFNMHAAGDLFAHTIVNEFSEGVFPAFTTIFNEEERLSAALKHFLSENYIGDATPGADNGGRSGTQHFRVADWGYRTLGGMDRWGHGWTDGDTAFCSPYSSRNPVGQQVLCPRQLISVS